MRNMYMRTPMRALAAAVALLLFGGALTGCKPDTEPVNGEESAIQSSDQTVPSGQGTGPTIPYATSTEPGGTDDGDATGTQNGGTQETDSDGRPTSGTEATSKTTGATNRPTSPPTARPTTRPTESDKYRPKCTVDDTIRNLGLCVTAYNGADYGMSQSDMRARISTYKDCGFKSMRLETYWGSIEYSPGFSETPYQDTLFQEVKNSGMRIKMILGTIMGVPGWYLNGSRPDYYMMDENGRRAVSTPSYFAPGLRAQMTQGLDQMMQYLKNARLLDSIDAIVVDCGPAGEPIYPPAWTQEGGLDGPSGGEVFWGYDVYSQQNFRETMRSKYGTIQAANRAWGATYSSFDQVSAPKQNRNGGTQLWKDWLNWYRDSKREFIVDQVEMYRAAVNRYTGGRIKLILYIPGTDVRDDWFQAALDAGYSDNGNVRIMCDSRFLIDTAKKYGLYLQYTGFENEAETRYLRSYMDASGAGSIPLFGENAGGYNAVQNAAAMQRIVQENGLAGIDVTHSRWLFQSETSLNKSPYYNNMKATMSALKEYLG